MSVSDLRLYILNSTAMVVSFSNVEATLKIFLLCVSIVYTVLKIMELIKSKKANKDEKH